MVPPKKQLRKPISPNQVILDERQDLSLALPLRRPLVPEAVVIQDKGPLVLDSALQEGNLPQGSLEDVTTGSLPYLRPKRQYNFKMFYNSARRRGGEEGKKVAE